VSDEEKEEDLNPFLTKQMLLHSLQQARRSVTKADLERYMKYKRDMERRLGMDEGQAEIHGADRVVGLDPEAPRGGRAPAPPNPSSSSSTASSSTASSTSTTSAPAARNFAEEDDEDDIYGE